MNTKQTGNLLMSLNLFIGVTVRLSLKDPSVSRTDAVSMVAVTLGSLL